MTRRLALVLACSPAVLVLRRGASAAPYLPPPGKVWSGLTAGFDASDFERRAGKHPAIWQHFVAWGGNYQYTLDNSRRARTRLMYHLSTSKGQNLPERFSPGRSRAAPATGSCSPSPATSPRPAPPPTSARSAR